MNTDNFIEMLQNLCDEKHIRLNSLRNGIIDRKTEISWRKNQNLPFELVAALFQRVEEPIGGIDLLLYDDDFQRLALRKKIEAAISIGQIGEAEHYLEALSKAKGYSGVLHQQYIDMMRAFLWYYQGREDVATCEQLLCDAFALTFSPGIQGFLCMDREKRSKLLFCREELHILILLGEIKRQQKDWNMTEQILFALSDYYGKRDIMQREISRVYVKYAWLQCQYYLDTGKRAHVSSIFQSAIKSIGKNGTSLFLKELIQQEEAAIKGYENPLYEKKLKNWRDSIDFIYALVEFPEIDPFRQILLNDDSPVVINENSYFRIERELQGLSRETISQEDFTPAMIKGIETGKNRLTTEKRKRMYEMLHLKYRQGIGSYITKDYKVFEEIRKYICAVSDRNWTVADATSNTIAKLLDPSQGINKQATMRKIMEHHRAHDSTSLQQVVSWREEAIKYTMKDYNGEIHRIPFADESELLLQLNIAKERKGDGQAAIESYKQILSVYETEDINRFHMPIREAIMQNLGAILEEQGELAEAERINREVIYISLRLSHIDIATEVLTNLACVYEKRGKMEFCEKCLRHSYFIMEAQDNPNREMIREYYHQVFPDKQL